MSEVTFVPGMYGCPTYCVVKFGWPNTQQLHYNGAALLASGCQIAAWSTHIAQQSVTLKTASWQGAGQRVQNGAQATPTLPAE